MNWCIDEAIAEAVTEYSSRNELRITDEGTERLGVLAHELRNLLNTATLSFEHIRSGHVAVGGSTGLLHGRSLLGLRDLIDRSLADVRLDAGLVRREDIPVATLLEEVEIGAVIQAQARNLSLTFGVVDREVLVVGDRQILAAALANLLQNAFKFSHKGSSVSLTTRVTADRVQFDIEDECGGLPAGKIADLFRPFEQRGGDRSGVGLGLSICRKAAASNGGELRVRDLPGKGCVFTLDLPRRQIRPFGAL
jgi:signal transduction histidine kinase